MTELEQALADAKIEAEIAKLKAETERLKDRALLDKKLTVELNKSIAETSKINGEAKWYPFVMGAGMVAATATIVKLFF